MSARNDGAVISWVFAADGGVRPNESEAQSRGPVRHGQCLRSGALWTK